MTLKQSIRIVAGFALGCLGAIDVYRAAAGGAGKGDVKHGLLFLAGAAMLLGAAFLERTVSGRSAVRPKGGAAVHGDAEKGRQVVAKWLKNLPDIKKTSAGAPKGTPDNPTPQTYDFDNGTCPYKRDASKPLGSRENPVVAGIPESSTHLVFSSERGCWILTDGLGNGWIR